MAPELLDPEPSASHCTKESDYYSLGMVIYEVLSGESPFAATHHIYKVVIDVIAGVRPSRPRGTQGAWFTDSLWEMLELCWRREPGDRPHLELCFGVCRVPHHGRSTPLSLMYVWRQILIRSRMAWRRNTVCFYRPRFSARSLIFLATQ